MTAAARGVPFWSPPEVDASIAGTLAHLQVHGVLAYPTETVYGFKRSDRQHVSRAAGRHETSTCGEALPPAHFRQYDDRAPRAAAIACRRAPRRALLAGPADPQAPAAANDAYRRACVGPKGAWPCAGRPIPACSASYRRWATHRPGRARIALGLPPAMSAGDILALLERGDRRRHDPPSRRRSARRLRRRRRWWTAPATGRASSVPERSTCPRFARACPT